MNLIATGQLVKAAQEAEEEEKEERRENLPLWLRGSRWAEEPDEEGSVNIPDAIRRLAGAGIGGGIGSGIGTAIGGAGGDPKTALIGSLIGLLGGGAAGALGAPHVMPKHLYEYERHTA